MSSSDGLAADGDLFASGSAADDVTVPEFKGWSTKKFYDYDKYVVDYEDMDSLAEAMTAARRAHLRLVDNINVCEREESRAKLIYKRSWNRAYMESTERTVEARKIRADLKCERLEDNVEVAKQKKAELLRQAQAIREELEALQAHGNNLRQQMKIL